MVFEELGFFEPSASFLLLLLRPSGKSVTDFLRERETHARSSGERERNYRDLSAALRDLDISNREAGDRPLL